MYVLCEYVRTYVCMFTYIYCMYVCMYACMYVCMYVYRYVCMYACMHICMCVCILSPKDDRIREFLLYVRSYGYWWVTENHICITKHIRCG